MVVRKLLRQLTEQLAQAGVEDAAYDAGELFRIATGRSPYSFAPDETLTEADAARLAALAERRAARYPLQYLAGSWGFYNIELAVGEGVLIPRADTETVVEQALSLLAGRKKPAVVDLCAGSGAIGCAIARNRPDAAVTCVELSPEAFGWLAKNCAVYGPAPVQADVFGWEGTLPDAALSLLTANPPYVTDQEYGTLAPELAFEPKMALVAKEEGLAFYRAIAARYFAKLSPGGAVCFEIGFAQRAAVEQILRENGYTEIGCVRDLAGADRCVYGKRPENGTVK